jgi:major membrane immunogen (membrane-anchored lipoprotein)
MRNIGLKLTVMLLGAWLLTGCGGGHKTTISQPSGNTLGKELMDLDAAYKQGTISEKEYNKAKKQLLDN